ncbi:hypothetical protein XENOCAPTIV_004469 [Xenoophorus captivus]|uniref:Uncharacterized protein n=1 Tax=Xenoophorus captivus TaxID=1517983 RepID=A0ABV0RNP2_9TELE
MENDRVPCFTVCPWHGLAVGHVVLFHVVEADELRAFKMEDITSVELDAGLSVVSVRLSDPRNVSYHCIGCKNVYRVLFADNVSGDTLIQLVILTNEPYKLSSKWQVDSCYSLCLKIAGMDTLPFSHNHPIHKDKSREALINVLPFMLSKSLWTAYQARGAWDKIMSSNETQLCGRKAPGHRDIRVCKQPEHFPSGSRQDTGPWISTLVRWEDRGFASVAATHPGLYRSMSAFANNFSVVDHANRHVKVLVESPSERLGYIEGEITLTLIYESSILGIYQKVKREQEVEENKDAEGHAAVCVQQFSDQVLLRKWPLCFHTTDPMPLKD